MADNGVDRVEDQPGEIVRERFYAFLDYRDPRLDEEAAQGEVVREKVDPRDYVGQIKRMVENTDTTERKSTIYVDFNHINDYDRELAEALELEYFRFEPALRRALQQYVLLKHSDYVDDLPGRNREFFVAFYNLRTVEKIRGMRSDKIGRLISISGTITRSSEVRPELLYGAFVCQQCAREIPNVNQQFEYTEPPCCSDHACSGRKFVHRFEKSTFVDWQRIRMQENADQIPAGSMPRCIDVVCRNDIVERAKAGDKIIFTGTVVVAPDTTGLGTVGESTVSGRTGSSRSAEADGVTGLKKLGAKEMTYKLMFLACTVEHVKDAASADARGRDLVGMWGESTDDGGESGADALSSFTEFEIDQIKAMRSTPKLYLKLVSSICPSVSGHLEVKRGILLQLFGGVHKEKKGEGISLRGDINVCIVGDPSCAKSQFLKFVKGFMPRCVYTSGKASSAAGLTATVAKDGETGEFCIEAGALMLADNGICCIDEFDKMDPVDQVAIHEAMEQQTITITKAGVQATLNARTSILAAANPVFGRYDRTKTLKANVAVSAPIMSRFDLFFVVLDECNPELDEKIARHIVRMHRANGASLAEQDAPFSTDEMRLYIRFARNIKPFFDPSREDCQKARRELVRCYRALRQGDLQGKNKTAYRITVRQLESLIRLSEALARVHCDQFIRSVYVTEAFRLLQKSIIFVESVDVELDDIENKMDDIKNEMDRDAEDGYDNDGDGDDDNDGDDDGDVNGLDTDHNSIQDDEALVDAKVNEVLGSRNGSNGGTVRDEEMDADGGAGPETEATAAPYSGGEESEAGTASAVAVDSENSRPVETNKRPSPSTDAAGDKRKKKKKKTAKTTAAAPTKEKTKMAYEDYQRMTSLLQQFLRNQDEEDKAKGTPFADIAVWYLNRPHVMAQLTEGGIEAYDEQKALVHKVLKRMVRSEGTVIEVEESSGGGTGEGEAQLAFEQRSFRLHPTHDHE